MKTGKSERDLLLDQTLALVKAAIDHDSVSSSTARARQNPMLRNEFAAEKIARKERVPFGPGHIVARRARLPRGTEGDRNNMGS